MRDKLVQFRAEQHRSSAMVEDLRALRRGKVDEAIYKGYQAIVAEDPAMVAEENAEAEALRARMQAVSSSTSAEAEAQVMPMRAQEATPASFALDRWADDSNVQSRRDYVENVFNDAA